MNTEMPAIDVQGVCRAFGKKRAVQDVSLTVGHGRIYGLLGRNGAGKTTLLKMMAGLIRPDAGAIQVNGTNPWRFTAVERQRIGYVSERSVLPKEFKVEDLVNFCAPLYSAWDHAKVERLLAQFRIDRKQRVKRLSLGAGRQVALILALAQRPTVLILDEPAVGLDVIARREFIDEMLALLREEGTTVLLSSHVLTDVERVADEIGIIVGGRLKLSEPLDRLKETVKRVRFHAPDRIGLGEVPLGTLRSRPSGSDLLVTLRVDDAASVREWARARGLQCDMHDLSLEDIFVDLVEES